MPFVQRFRRLLALAALLNATLTSLAADLNVFAAASLSDALTEIAKTYEPASGDKLRLNLAASSLLARQIKEGAPADIFLSADEAKMDDLAKAGLLLAGTRRPLLGNTLVIVVNAENGPALSAPADLAKPAIARIALAEPQTVPAGIYAKTFLQNAGLWEKLSAKIIPTENVRACLAAVESGNVDAGIVYKTDALISRKVKIAYEIPAAEGPKITYPLAVLKDTKHEEAARKFAARLASPEARAIFEKYGFISDVGGVPSPR
ncbi:molybdate ABC transporter substrate-binding protein [Nibricoccus aquaticus]|uniref:molybdate ABC transporter substrate-binding protein n=1 Tax=Nibricoccus aquaticus TaxID=2576891 RepID=UPI001FEC7697|nr:molybdate ABC transporter substrate-binding protein [Nibricoccus aquaticus]